MSFRSRLLLFFTIIVVVPMGAVALLLSSITSQSEIGKADARIAEGLRVAFALYRQHRAEATPQLRRIAREPALQRALGASTPAAAGRQLAHLIKPPVTAVALHDKKGGLVAAAGSRPPVSPPVGAPPRKGGGAVGSLAGSVTTPSALVHPGGG